MWLILYGRDAVRHKPKNSLKTQKMHFLPVFEHQSILHIQKFSGKNIENWRSPENDFCLVFGYWVVQFFLFFLNEKHQGGSYKVVFISVLWMVSSES